MKNVQIPEELFFSLVKYFLLEDFEEERSIRSGLEKKFESMRRHETYTRFKTAESEKEKEEARQAYLDMVGMRKSFRW